jgi:signal transduction histidine kinase
MKKPTTMRRAVIWSTLVVTGLMLASYTLLLIHYFEEGMASVIQAEMFYTLSNNEEKLQNNINPDSAVEITPESFLVYQQLPEEWIDLFTGEDLFSLEDLKSGDIAYAESDNPDDEFITIHLMLPYRLSDGRKVYATQTFKTNEALEKKLEDDNTMLYLIVVVAVFFLLLIMFVVVRLGRRLSRPADSLSQWADQLTLDNRLDTRPDFAFKELNKVADCLQDAFNRIGGFLERERSFLRHASHELRTPVAIVKANVELMNKCDVDPRTELSLGRIDRASRNMQKLIETLLWISREEAKEMVYEDVNLCELLTESTDELSYLLKGKPVTYSLQCHDQVILTLPRVPFQILCNNLLHNAFQHTAEGEISICLTSKKLEICNQDVTLAEHGDRVEESFGIGIELVQMLARKMEWDVHLCPEPCGYRASLIFPEAGQ